MALPRLETGEVPNLIGGLLDVVALAPHQATGADQAVATGEDLAPELRGWTAALGGLLIDLLDFLVDHLHQSREAPGERAEHAGDDRLVGGGRVVRQHAGQLLQRTTGLLPDAHDPAVAHIDVHLNRLRQPADDRLHAVENELSMAVEKAPLGQLTEAQRASCGFGINAARLRQLGHVLRRRPYNIQPKELAALQERAQLLWARVAQPSHVLTVVSGQDVPAVDSAPSGMSRLSTLKDRQDRPEHLFLHDFVYQRPTGRRAVKPPTSSEAPRPRTAPAHLQGRAASASEKLSLQRLGLELDHEHAYLNVADVLGRVWRERFGPRNFGGPKWCAGDSSVKRDVPIAVATDEVRAALHVLDAWPAMGVDRCGRPNWDVGLEHTHSVVLEQDPMILRCGG